jgi:DNA-directed RNA polymerase specialized sigma24 family protein
MTLIDTDSSDAQLIERVRANDLSALGGLFDRYYAQVYRAAVAITQDSAVAEDIAQDPIWASPDHIAEHTEIQTQVREAIRELNFNQRVVVVLHYMSGLSLEEIAEIIDCPVGTVKSRLYYARENLRRRLDAVNWPNEVAHGFAR